MCLGGGVTNPEISTIQQSNNINENNENDSESEQVVKVSHTNVKPYGFTSQMVQMMSSYNLIASFSNLYLTFKAKCTISVSFASAERVFSKVR